MRIPFFRRRDQNAPPVEHVAKRNVVQIDAEVLSAVFVAPG
jgi:hypothetical protein